MVIFVVGMAAMVVAVIIILMTRMVRTMVIVVVVIVRIMTMIWLPPCHQGAFAVDASIPDRAALFLEKPNHVSFLSERSNNNMISQLGPILPLARALGLQLLDFDKYYEVRDSRETSRAFLPTLESFFIYHLGPLP
jgi:hypothetical protein